MQRIKIEKLGPIEYCELDVSPFIVLTGAQSSGKSTVAKAVYFFKMLKVIIAQQIQKECMAREMNNEHNSLEYRVIKELRSVFLQEFGSTWGMDRHLHLSYQYSENLWVEISLKKDRKNPNYIWIRFSKALSGMIQEWEKRYIETVNIFWYEKILQEVGKDIEDEYDIVYIPAGRSMMTLLSGQMNYIYSMMDDNQKRMLDYCTQNYMELTMRLKPYFSQGLEEMVNEVYQLTTRKVNRPVIERAQRFIRAILQGEYRFVAGEERLLLEDNYVKINFASSGQQESVWILNLLFYYLLYQKKAFFIIEEPESHLFPDAQKLMTEFISLFQNQGNQVILTTHSPYVLGSINNMLYANKVAEQGISGVEEIVDRNVWMDCKQMEAYYVQNGEIASCKDEEMKCIRNEVIDGASADINEAYDKLLELLYDKGEKRYDFGESSL